jgi:adenylate kinase
LVEYYSAWSKNGDPAAKVPAPAYRKIEGTGSVDAITASVFAALK